MFRSQEYHALIYCFQQLFDRVESTKPMASRSQSAEIYVICKGYKAPSKIDKRLLDPSHMFAETQDDGPRVIDVLNPKEVQKRNRGGCVPGAAMWRARQNELHSRCAFPWVVVLCDLRWTPIHSFPHAIAFPARVHRYEAGTGVLYKECSAEEFVTSDRPADILGAGAEGPPQAPPPSCSAACAMALHMSRGYISEYLTFVASCPGAGIFNRMTVEPGSELAEHPETSVEVQALMADLRVLGRKEFKQLLKWRQEARRGPRLWLCCSWLCVCSAPRWRISAGDLEILSEALAVVVPACPVQVIKTRKRAEKEVLKAAGKDKPAKTEGGEEDEEDKLMEEMEGLQVGH